MIKSLHDDSNFIYAYIEYEVVNEHGKSDKDGKYLYVSDLWIHEWYRLRGCLKALIRLVNLDEKIKSTRWVYWNRLKYNYRISKSYSRLGLSLKGNRHEQAKSRYARATESISAS